MSDPHADEVRVADEVRAAEEAALRGDLVEAASRADAALGSQVDPGARARAARVLAAVLAHRGLLARSAELHRWAAQIDPTTTDPAAAVAWIGTGILPGTDSGEPGVVPTMRAGADALTARGLGASVQGSSGTALSDLARAAAIAECTGTPTLHDDTPAALGALVALHRGEPELGRGLLDRAIAADLGAVPARRRHHLLRAWTRMAEDDDPGARSELVVALELPAAMEARDDMLAVGLEAALARRAGDTEHLLALSARGRAAVLRHPVDLYALLPLGELTIVAARLGQNTWLTPHTRAADQLLAALGRPPLWAAPWHWAGLLAAITEDNQQSAIHHTHQLAELADSDESRPPLLAQGAACWVEIRAGHIDPTTVTAVAGALQAAGLAWEGARLAKDAAVRTTDRKAISSLLNCARALSPARPGPSAPPPSTGLEPPPDPATLAPVDPSTAEPAPGLLSAREREVAMLMLDGLTYREIGDQLYITAKTVEHHVKRMRQRLGSESRSELFHDLRATLNKAA